MIIIPTKMTEMPKSCVWSEDEGYKRCQYCNTKFCEIEKRFNGYLKVNDPRPDWCPLQEINDNECKHCGSKDTYTKEKGPHLGLYCSKCKKWIKWLSKTNDIPIINDNDYDFNDELPWR